MEHIVLDADLRQEVSRLDEYWLDGRTEIF